MTTFQDFIKPKIDLTEAVNIKKALGDVVGTFKSRAKNSKGEAKAAFEECANVLSGFADQMPKQ